MPECRPQLQDLMMTSTPFRRPVVRPAARRDRSGRHPRSLVGAAALALLLLAGCGTMAPPYQRPEGAVPTTIRANVPGSTASADGAVAGTVTGRAADTAWQQFVLDDRLRQVIAQALADNRGLRQALADVEVARASYRGSRAELFPTVSVGVDGSRAKASTSAGGTAIGNSVSAIAGVSAWELDLFGKLRSQSDAAWQSTLATAETARATQLALVGETANAWLTLAADRSQLALAEQTVESANRSRQLTVDRLNHGVASRSDVRQADQVLQQARADVASLQTTVAQDLHALNLLAGGSVDERLLPDTLEALASSSSAPGVGPLGDVPVDLSSRALLERPDVRSAEHTLEAANADIGAARAAFFPRSA